VPLPSTTDGPAVQVPLMETTLLLLAVTTIRLPEVGADQPSPELIVSDAVVAALLAR
jgi:hypothetical protein